MASSGGERRLLFDTRGKRKHVIRVVYAILALLMGASLFLVVGPVNLGALIGNSSESSSAAKVLDEQAERIEAKLTKEPTDERLLLALTRARVNAGNAQLETNPETGAAVVPLAARNEFQTGSEAWSRYLKVADEPSPTGAQLIAGTYFRMAEGSTTVPEAQENVAKAAKAQAIAAEQSPSLGTLSTLAIYEYYAGDFAAGDKATKQAAAKTGSKAEGKSVEKQLAEFRKRGKSFEKQKKEVAKAEKKAGKEGLQNPLGFTPGSLSK
jgi:hypothetical protein